MKTNRMQSFVRLMMMSAACGGGVHLHDSRSAYGISQNLAGARQRIDKAI